MKRVAMITLLLMGVATSACARDFWSIYGEKLSYNYAVKAGTGLSTDVSHRLKSSEIFGVATKSFSQTLGVRFLEIAKSRRGVLIVCMFSQEPDRCYLDVVAHATFKEVHFLNAPGFSQRFIKRASKFYTGSFYKRDSAFGKKFRASNVPTWKIFNPVFGFDMKEFELVVSSPFYTYFGIYVEPQYGSRKGPSLGFMKDRFTMDVYRDHMSFHYHFPERTVGKNYISLSYIPHGEICLENVLMAW